MSYKQYKPWNLNDEDLRRVLGVGGQIWKKYRSYFPKKKPNINAGLMALKKVRLMQKGIEKKYHERQVAQSVVTHDTTGYVGNMVYIPQGDVDNERIGNKVLVKSMYVRGFFECTMANAEGARISMILDRRPISGSLPTRDTVYTDNKHWAHLEWKNRQRFKVLYDTIVPWTDLTLAGGKWYFKMFRRFSHKDGTGGLVVEYDGETADDVVKNAILMMVGYDDGGVNDAAITFRAKFVYTDA